MKKLYLLVDLDFPDEIVASSHKRNDLVLKIGQDFLKGAKIDTYTILEVDVENAMISDLDVFFSNVVRSEAYDKQQAQAFEKGIGATLIALGYNEKWVEGAFRIKYEEYLKKTNKESNSEAGEDLFNELGKIF